MARGEGGKQGIVKIAIASVIITIIAVALFIVAKMFVLPMFSENDGVVEEETAIVAEENQQSEEQDAEEQEEEEQLLFPTGWLVADYESIPAMTPVSILFMPNFDVVAHDEIGQTSHVARTLPPDSTLASVSYNGETVQVDPNMLLINLPDLLPNAIYDIRYAYGAPSRAGGHDIPNLTNTTLPGYNGKLTNAYLNQMQYVVPCAYATAMKLVTADSILWSEHNYRMVFWDIYRSTNAATQISQALSSAITSDPDVQQSLGGWDQTWYVSNGVSNHSLGTAVDVSLADASGKTLVMPSEFDAFDISGHLTEQPMNANDINFEAFREEVRNNSACVALHDAMTRAGFTEIASEWWHFDDQQAKTAVSTLTNGQGLNFDAVLVAKQEQQQQQQ